MRDGSRTFRRFGVVLLILLLIAAPVAAQAGPWTFDQQVIDTSGETNLPYDIAYGNDDHYYVMGDAIVYEYELDGTFVTSYDISGNGINQNTLYQLDNSSFLTTNNAIPDTVELYDSSFTHQKSISLPDWIGTAAGIWQGENGNYYIIDSGDNEVTEFDSSFNSVANYSLTGVSDADDLIQVEDNWYVLDSGSVVVEYTDTFSQTGETFDLSSEDTNMQGLGFEGAYFYASGFENDAVYRYTSGLEPDVETDLELEIRNWMPFNSTQEYTVILNETNTTSGDTNLTDVTADANVTVYNITDTTNFTSPIVTVNNTSDTLVSHQSTGVVAVNATYGGNTLDNASNVTVGNRNLSNIGIMPPSQWLASFLEVDNTEGPHGIGSPIQWILFIVLAMAAASRMFDNPWAGIGTGVMVSILLWVLTYIGLGVVLSTVFIGILLGLAILRVQMSATAGDISVRRV